MKPASLRVAVSLLLALSMSFTGTVLPFPLTSPAKSQITASKRELKPAFGATRRFAPTSTAAGQAGNSSKGIRISIEEGKSGRKTFGLNHVCRTPNHFDIKSDKKFFQLEGPTGSPPGSALLRTGENPSFANVDARKLKPGVYHIKVTLTCLDCVKPCNQNKSPIFFEVTVVKPSSQVPQTTPQAPATPSTEPSQGAAEEPDQKMRELFDGGPQFPKTFDMSNFSAFYLIRGGWFIVLKYELAEGATVSVTVRPLRIGGPMMFELPSTGMGQAKTVILPLPEKSGAPLQAAAVTVKAVVSARVKGVRPANFNIHALGFGTAALGAQKPPNNLRRASFFDAARWEVGGDNFSPFSFLKSLQTGEVAIDGIDLKPSDVLNASQGSSLLFSFRSTNDFPLWSASIRRQTVTGGTFWGEENLLPFKDEPIKQGQPISKSWNGKTRKGHIVPGNYTILINAWTAVSGNNGSLTSFSSPPIRVY